MIFEKNSTRAKRAQMVSEVFIYIVSAAVFLMILIFGYRAVLGILASQDTTILVDFKTQLQGSIEKMKIRKGSVDIQTFSLPTKYTRVCLLQSATDEQTTLSNQLQTDYPQYYSAWKTGTENIFLSPKQELPLYLPNIEIDNGYFCKDIDGKFTLRIEGLGKTVRIAP